MKLYLVERDEYEYDECYAAVVRAESPEQARLLAACEDAEGCEPPSARLMGHWNDGTVTEIAAEGEATMILPAIHFG